MKHTHSILRQTFKSLATQKRSYAISGYAKFDWEDALNLESLLTEEERMVRDQVRQYCQEKLMPRVLKAYRDEKFDRNILYEMGELGLLGSTVQGYGCAGTNYVTYGLIAREVERLVFHFFHFIFFYCVS